MASAKKPRTFVLGFVYDEKRHSDTKLSSTENSSHSDFRKASETEKEGYSHLQVNQALGDPKLIHIQIKL